MFCFAGPCLTGIFLRPDSVNPNRGVSVDFRLLRTGLKADFQHPELVKERSKSIQGGKQGVKERRSSSVDREGYAQSKSNPSLTGR